MRRARLLLACGFVLVAALGGCSNPPDGVLSVAFLFGPPLPGEARFWPPASELGVDPSVLANASGRCDVDVTTAIARCTFKGLPALKPTDGGAPRAYELRLILGGAPTPPRTNAANVERYPNDPDPDNPLTSRPEVLPRSVLGAFGVDPFGQATGTFTTTDPLDRTLGGELMLKSPQADGTTRRYLVIDGRVGNVPSDPAATTSTADTGGHHH